FCLHHSAPLRSPPSLPTRRSSDLSPLAARSVGPSPWILPGDPSRSEAAGLRGRRRFGVAPGPRPAGRRRGRGRERRSLVGVLRCAGGGTWSSPASSLVALPPSGHTRPSGRRRTVNTAERAPLPITLADTAAPVRMWLPREEADDAALADLRNIASLPGLHGGRAMPDCRLGSGATGGGVIATRDAGSPAAVGVDIGCGVAAVRTDLVEEDLEDLGALRSAVEAAIPVGFAAHEEALSAGELSRLGARAGLEQFWEG